MVEMRATLSPLNPDIAHFNQYILYDIAFLMLVIVDNINLQAAWRWAQYL